MSHFLPLIDSPDYHHSHKTPLQGEMFKPILENSIFYMYLKNAESVKNGDVKNEIYDGKKIGRHQNMDILLNYKNASMIIRKHAKLDIHDLVRAINEPDRVIISKGEKGTIINFIKTSHTGFEVVGGIEISGYNFYAVTTHYERLLGKNHQENRRTQNHLDQLLGRGEIVYSSGKTADLPSVSISEPASEP